MVESLDLTRLIDELRALPKENERVEFKTNNIQPDMVGRNISALANASARRGVPHGYLVWGIDDKNHEVSGTSFYPENSRSGGEELENWLRHMLSANASFDFSETTYKGKHVVVLQVDPAAGNTVDFKHIAYIRIGSYTKQLKNYPSIEAEVWKRLSRAAFESEDALGGLAVEEAIELLDYPKYYSLLGIPMPLSPNEVAAHLTEDGVMRRRDDGLYAITNLGTLLLAKDLSKFPTVSRKAIRIIQYKSNTKIHMLRERTSSVGYAIAFESAIGYIMAITPAEEAINQGIRVTKTQYPEAAIREIFANMLIHQDLTVSGSGPIVEVFDGRIDFTNPGLPLINVLRFLDNPPRSRNEGLASLMRRFGMCEEAGSGWDKIISSCEEKAMPAPRVVTYDANDGSIRVSLHPHTSYGLMDSEERIMTCYWHACLCFLEQRPMTNSSLRARFGASAPSPSTITRLIQDTIASGLITPVTAGTSNRYRKYLPSWAQQER